MWNHWPRNTNWHRSLLVSLIYQTLNPEWDGQIAAKHINHQVSCGIRIVGNCVLAEVCNSDFRKDKGRTEISVFSLLQYWSSAPVVENMQDGGQIESYTHRMRRMNIQTDGWLKGPTDRQTDKVILLSKVCTSKAKTCYHTSFVLMFNSACDCVCTYLCSYAFVYVCMHLLVFDHLFSLLFHLVPPYSAPSAGTGPVGTFDVTIVVVSFLYLGFSIVETAGQIGLITHSNEN